MNIQISLQRKVQRPWFIAHCCRSFASNGGYLSKFMPQNCLPVVL